MRKKAVMIDLETMSVTKKAAILSIGAVTFDPRLFTQPHKEVEYDSFYANVSLASCEEIGLVTDSSTMEWWERPSQVEAWQSLQVNQLNIRVALLSLRRWLLGDTDIENIEVWANGTSFDLAILETAYLFCELPHPWKFFNERDYRTMKMLYSDVERSQFLGRKHNALDDAAFQAAHLMKIMRHIHSLNIAAGASNASS